MIYSVESALAKAGYVAHPFVGVDIADACHEVYFGLVAYVGFPIGYSLWTLPSGGDTNVLHGAAIVDNWSQMEPGQWIVLWTETRTLGGDLYYEVNKALQFGSTAWYDVFPDADYAPSQSARPEFSQAHGQYGKQAPNNRTIAKEYTMAGNTGIGAALFSAAGTGTRPPGRDGYDSGRATTLRPAWNDGFGSAAKGGARVKASTGDDISLPLTLPPGYKNKPYPGIAPLTWYAAVVKFVHGLVDGLEKAFK